MISQTNKIGLFLPNFSHKTKKKYCHLIVGAFWYLRNPGGKCISFDPEVCEKV